jgi:hypothetical protein
MTFILRQARETVGRDVLHAPFARTANELELEADFQNPHPQTWGLNPREMLENLIAGDKL